MGFRKTSVRRIFIETPPPEASSKRHHTNKNHEYFCELRRIALFILSNRTTHTIIGMIPQFKVLLKSNEDESARLAFLKKKRAEQLQQREAWVRAAMFCTAALLILYTQSFTRNQEKVSEEDLGLVYTLYTCSLLLLAGMSVLWQ